MKTFLWTSLFWIIAGIALLLCLWFGNLGTQVLENDWLARIMPKNLQCDYDSVVTSTLESIDWCEVAETNGCYPAVEEDNDVENLSWDMARLQKPLSDIMENQQIIYDYLQESFGSLNKSIEGVSQSVADLETVGSIQYAEPVIDEKEKQRLELQAQIEALQEEMENL